MMRYFVGFIVTMGLIILLIVLLFTGGGNKSKSPTDTSVKPLVSYADTDAEIQLTIDGPTNADQIHQQVRISVDRDDATFEQIQGYNGNVVNMQHFASNRNAYAAFLYALARAGLNTKDKVDSSLTDERGYCPLGDRYIFELRQGGNDIVRYWATNCGGTKTYRGNVNLSVTLFQRQIPGYGTLTQNINF